MFFKASCAVLVTIFMAFSAFATPLNVVVTIHPLADIVKKIGGENVKVHILLKPGEGPHTFEPAPGDMKTIGAADLILIVGFDLEIWLEKLLKITSPDKKDLLIDLSTTVLHPIDIANDAGEHHNHHHGHINPHYWLDPLAIREAVLLIERKLIEKLPAKAAEISKNTRVIEGELDKLNEQIKTLLKAPGVSRSFVAFHNSWSYFARRYGLKIAGVIQTAPGREPSAKHFKKLIQEIEKMGVKSVLVEPQFSLQLGETLADEAGVKVIMVDPIGGVAGREGYFELMRYNAKMFATALSDQ